VRWESIVQTAVFVGALLVLVAVLYTSVVVQQNRQEVAQRQEAAQAEATAVRKVAPASSAYPAPEGVPTPAAYPFPGRPAGIDAYPLPTPTDAIR
jgi:hypothetical protein